MMRRFCQGRGGAGGKSAAPVAQVARFDHSRKRYGANLETSGHKLLLFPRVSHG